MTRLVDLLFAARPLLHLPIWSVYLVTQATVGGAMTPPWINLATLSALSLVAAGAYYLNQIYDHESDRINQKLGFLQRGLVSERQLWWGYLGATLAGLVIAGTISLMLLSLMALQVILGYCYSAPPTRFKDRPLAGLVVNSISFGFLVPLAATISVAPYWHPPELLTAVYFLLAVSSTHVLTTIPDRAGDTAAGKRTVAVVLSESGTKVLALAPAALSVVLALVLGRPELVILAVVASLTTAATLVLSDDKAILLAAKLPLLLLSLLAGYYRPYYLVFIVALVFLTRVYYRQRFGQRYPKLT